MSTCNCKEVMEFLTALGYGLLIIGLMALAFHQLGYWISYAINRK